MKKVVIYTRVASQSQVDSNASEIQEQFCRSYAKENKLDVVKVFRDIGASGKHIHNRQQLQKLLKYCSKKTDIDSVIVYKIDRWSRNVEEGLAAEAYLSKQGISLISASENIEPTPTGKFINVILSASAFLDNDIKSQRIKDSMMEAFEKGNWLWKTPFGYKRVIKKQVNPLVITKEESRIVEEIFTMASNGKTVNEICDSIQSNNNFQKDFTSPISIKRLIQNPFYKGYMKSSFSNELVEGNHQPIVSSEVWERANKNITN